MRISDWSSDVCSSDLLFGRQAVQIDCHQYLRIISRGGEATPWQFRDDNRKRGVIPNAETSCGFENVVWITSFEVNHAARRPHLAGLFPLPFKGRAGVGMGFRDRKSTRLNLRH